MIYLYCIAQANPFNTFLDKKNYLNVEPELLIIGAIDEQWRGSVTPPPSPDIQFLF